MLGAVLGGAIADNGGEGSACVEAGGGAGVAGGAYLVYGDEQGVSVAVNGDGLDVLGVAAGVAFAPVFLAGAGPEGDAAAGEGAVQGFVIHPAEHEHVFGVVLLNDGGEEAVLVAFEAGCDGSVQGGRACGVLSGVWCCAHSPSLNRPPPPGQKKTGR